LCSAKELGIAEDADGLLILPATARIGAPLSEIFPSDTILDLEITPNRADLLSYVGIAREVAALTEKKLTAKGAKDVKDLENLRAPGELRGSLVIQIDAPEQCPFYSARKISDVKVEASPGWLRNKL